MQVELTPDERDGIVEAIDIWLADATEVEKAMFDDKSIDDPAEFATAVHSHHDTEWMLVQLKEKLLNAG